MNCYYASFEFFDDTCTSQSPVHADLHIYLPVIDYLQCYVNKLLHFRAHRWTFLVHNYAALNIGSSQPLMRRYNAKHKATQHEAD